MCLVDWINVETLVRDAQWLLCIDTLQYGSADDEYDDSSDSEQTESKSAGTNSGTSSPAPSAVNFGNKKLFKGGTLSSITTSAMSKFLNLNCSSFMLFMNVHITGVAKNLTKRIQKVTYF